jgi:glycosyltransferase involved in cell wall biosynthesis
MRVLFVSPSAGLGGAERALIDALRSLRLVAPDWTLGVVATDDGPLVDETRRLAVDTTVLPLASGFAATGEFGRPAVATWLRLAASGGAAVGHARRLRAYFRRWAPDVVHSNGAKAHILSAWAAWSGLPLVWHVHDYVSARPVLAPLLRLHARRASLALANSHSVADDLRRVLGGAPRIETIYNAIDVERFAPEGPRLDLDAAASLPPAPEGTLRVGLSATFARWKGHDVFLRALAALSPSRNFRGYIIGGPVYRTGDASQVTREELQGLARSLGIEDRVGFTGLLQDTAPALRSLDVVVHASTAPEPFGLVIAEAMAAGRAVVMSDAGGAREIGTAEQTCLTHSPGNADALAGQIVRLLGDEALRRRLGAAAAESVRTRFTHRHMGEGLRSAYLSVSPAIEGAA